jgi:3-oxoacyl-[acyl-carrier protein] reductase
MSMQTDPRAVAIVTGGSRGIGYGIAMQLASAGYNLVINGVRPASSVSEIVSELKSTGADVLYCQADISSRDDRSRMLEEILSFYGKIDVLVNNAGIAPRERKDILEASEESFSELIDTNLKGPYFLTQAVARVMINQKNDQKNLKGCIVNISSISAVVASVNRGEYCIAKAGVSMATQLFAVRLAEYNIPVYEVRPGIIKTDMTAAVSDKYDKLISEGLTLQRRWGYPEDVGKAVLALVQGYLPYSTGQVLNVEGGMLIDRL